MYTIATHDGPFHADDVLAVAMLKNFDYPGNTRVLRTRDTEVLREADFVVDVGGVYDPATRRFDHHQRGYQARRASGVLYSSAGLVWKHLAPECFNADEVEYVDKVLVEGVCAVDNGQWSWPAGQLCQMPTFSGMIASFNPPWDRLIGLNEERQRERFDTAFRRAVEVAEQALENALWAAHSRNMARDVVMAALTLPAASDGVLLLDYFCPWQYTIHNTVEGDAINFVIFKNHKSQWVLQGVSKTATDRTLRVPLPSAWGGLEADALRALTGVPDAIFCHRGLFIAAAESKEGAFELWRLATVANRHE